MINGKIHYKLSCSIAMLNYQGVHIQLRTFLFFFWTAAPCPLPIQETLVASAPLTSQILQWIIRTRLGMKMGVPVKCIKMLAFMRKWRFMMIHHLKIGGIFSHKTICISQYEKRRDWSRVLWWVHHKKIQIGSTKIRDGFNQGGFTIQKCATCFPNDSVTNLGLAIGCNLSLSVQTEPRDPGFGFTRDKLCQF